MPRDSQGNTNPLPGTIVSTGYDILPSQHNPALTDLYAMMTQSLSRDGQGGMRANLAMNGFQITGLGSATQPGDAVPLSQLKGSMPIGSVIDYAGSNAPIGWLFCFGQQVSRTAYPDLFSVIGITFGSGNGSTTFNIPDMRGRVIAGKDNMGGTASGRLDNLGGQQGLIGGSGGSDRHVLSINEMPIHNHGGVTQNSGLHSHTGLLINVGAAGAGNGVVQSPGGSGRTNLGSAETGVEGIHNHEIQSQGQSFSHNNVQPTFIMNKIIKVSY